MITYHLGKEEVTGYARDLAIRLDQLGGNFPTKWFALGSSGRKVADELLDLLPDDKAASIDLGFVHYDRKDKKILFITSADGGAEADKLTRSESLDDVTFGDEPVLILDSAVHTGGTMLALINTLRGAGAKHFLSYTLVLKRGSAIIPTYFGVVIDDKDRALFQLDVIPNNRLAKPAPFGVLREVTDEDMDRPVASVGAPFTDFNVGDLIYDRDTKSSKAYIFEYEGEIAGFVSFRKTGPHTMFIDGWGTGEKFTGKKIGSSTIRWAETWARSMRCDRIELWAYEGAIDQYIRYGYEYSDEKWRVLTGKQRYRIMNKKILYNITVTNQGGLEVLDR